MEFIECPLHAASRAFPHAPAIIENSKELTYRELDELTGRFASQLTERGIGTGQRVGWQIENCAEVVALLWACFRKQIVACPISTRLPKSAVSELTRFIGASLVSGADLQAMKRRSLAPQECKVSPDAPASVVFSSGSTGRPKAVVHKLNAHVRSAQGANENLPLQAGDRWLLSLPAFHVGGLAIIFRCVEAGATIVIDRNMRELRDAFDRHQVTHASVVATQLKRMLQCDEPMPSGLKGVLLGGSSLPPELITRSLHENLPVRATYGLTEMASQVTTMPQLAAAELADRADSAGRVLDFRELRISEGEILVRGETLFQGYLDEQQPGDGKLNPCRTTDGWFATGDLGSMDSKGFLSVIGRADNMFISGGENVYPEEIENCLMDIDGVRQAIVVAVSNDEYGHRPVAFVDADEQDERTWRDILANALPKFKIPERFDVWPTHLIQSGIKPSRRDLTRLAEENT